MASDGVNLPKNSKQLGRIIDAHVSRETLKLTYRRTLWLLAWYYLNSGYETHAVGGKQANGFGLYDMLGNVWEWVNDWYGTYPPNAQTDPTGPVSGTSHMLRGGACSRTTDEVRSSGRSGLGGIAEYYIGFRVARTP